jgi:hypothetical protein
MGTDSSAKTLLTQTGPSALGQSNPSPFLLNLLAFQKPGTICATLHWVRRFS